ncbi:MAG: hypothetical protein IPP74_02945 [Alphaproteobacteria bacterium]|nr:hypothetical protein [Alphaproteobacteria bacterium]
MKEIENLRPQKKPKTVNYLANRETLLVTLLVSVVEIGIFVMAFLNIINFKVAIACHLVVVAFLIGWTMYVSKIQKGRRFSYILLMMITGVGPYGAFTCLLALILYKYYTRTSTNFMDWFANLFPEERTSQSAVIYERLLYGWDDFSEKRGVMSFRDVLVLGSEEQKRNAIAKMTLYFRPEFTEALQLALKDHSNSIRVQAATAIARIEEAFFKVLMELEKIYAETHNDDVLFKLANHADLYYHCGILDDERKVEILEKGIHYYSEYLSRHPENKQAQYALGRLFLNKKDYNAAYALLHGCIGITAAILPQVFKAFMECLYGMHRFADLHAFARDNASRLDPGNRKSLEILDSMKLWGVTFPVETLKLGKKYAG